MYKFRLFSKFCLCLQTLVKVRVRTKIRVIILSQILSTQGFYVIKSLHNKQIVLSYEYRVNTIKLITDI